MNFYHFLILTVVAAILTLWGRFLFARRTEYYRQRPLVKEALENTISQVRQHNFPWILVRDDTIHGLIADVLKVMPYCKRIRFKQKWNEYQDGTDEYENLGSISGRRLIIGRLQNLISMI